MLIALGAILAFLLVLFLVLKVVGFLLGLVWLLLIATVCGAVAERMLHYRQGGILATTGVGLVGAVVGTLLAHILHLPTQPAIAHLPILWTVAGSFALVGTMKVVAPSRRLQGGRGISRL